MLFKEAVSEIIEEIDIEDHMKVTTEQPERYKKNGCCYGEKIS